ncbi:poly [ADP-ribose] polymerase tankyrase-like [Ptychodera flava]|uniref:poly [ADP-ribose] polymerase tankyrase-like n=1 Tax=Ptychodera flava TaxID=63121 RepID=UPI003969FB79
MSSENGCDDSVGADNVAEETADDIFQAIKDGNKSWAFKCARRMDDFLIRKDGLNLLQHAALYGLADVVTALYFYSDFPELSKAVVEGEGEFAGLTALQLAEKARNTKVADRISDLLAADEHLSVLHRKARMGDIEAVKKLLAEKEVDVNITGSYGNTPLYMASAAGRFEIVKLLISAGADFLLRNSKGFAPVHISSMMGHGDVVRFLLEKGCDIHESENCDFIPLHPASDFGHAEVADLLIKHGSKIDVPSGSKSQCAPLHYAAVMDTNVWWKSF